MAEYSNISRKHQASGAEKATFLSLHLVVVALCAALVAAAHVDVGVLLPDRQRAYLLLACAALYWGRHAITLFYLLQRKVGWSEVVGLLGFIASFEIGLLLLGAGAFRDHAIALNSLDALAVGLVLLGSFLNTGSELQRKWWKRDSKNKGQCYTEGLFRHSMHVNYFGDIVLFTGWSLLTANLWALALPAAMTYLFVKLHIPSLDAHLEQRYGDSFRVYAANTKKLIPALY